MTETPTLPELTGVPDRLWSRVAEASHRILFLDYDGTLAPFHVDREKARASPDTLRWVREIASTRGTTVAVVSGRPLADLIIHLDSMPVILVGEHGWEILKPGGPVEEHPLRPGDLDNLRDALRAAELEEWSVRVERKRTALVLHTRGLPRSEAQRFLDAAGRAWGGIAERNGMRLDRTDGGIELRVAGRDKGSAVRGIMDACPRGALAVYVGDDVTDEDAFREVEGEGFAIRVGSPARVTVASGRLPTPRAVERFLERWLAVAPRPGTA